jgi:hypothetical protein
MSSSIRDLPHINPLRCPQSHLVAQTLVARRRLLARGAISSATRLWHLLAFAIVVAATVGLTRDLSASQLTRELLLKAESFLSFEDTTDGRCQNLSPGGKLTVIRNAHPTKSIRFRLIRYFVDVRQQGRATGVLLPGGDPVKIGCSRVDGRKQRWVVEKADFLSEQSP